MYAVTRVTVCSAANAHVTHPVVHCAPASATASQAMRGDLTCSGFTQRLFINHYTSAAVQ